jgi:hypothetical protein
MPTFEVGRQIWSGESKPDAVADAGEQGSAGSGDFQPVDT